MADKLVNENGDVLVPATERREVSLRNDTGVPYKFPTLQKEVAAGEVETISLRKDEPIPFGFTPVNPDDHERELKVNEKGIEIAPDTSEPKKAIRKDEPVNTTPAEGDK